MSGHAYALAMAALDVNGPADAPSDWNAIPWRHHEGNVRRLRQRIFKATRAQDYKTVRNLQRMMLRSWSNTLSACDRSRSATRAATRPGLMERSR
jgi:RNA-directed DNA polymerase